MNQRAPGEISAVMVREPGTQTIAARARELWASCGEPLVSDDAIWREAERELLGERRPRTSAIPHPRRSR